jgi:GNAT superfamily N-acetyltransferase
MNEGTSQATGEDVRRLWPAVSAAHLFDDLAGLLAWWEAAPWRIRVTRAGEAAVLGRWRDHLDMLAVRGLWCSTGRVPALVEDLRSVARAQGFGRLLGPLVPEDVIGPYLSAGMAVRQRIVVCRLQPPAVTMGPGPRGVTIRAGTPKDLASVAAVDEGCFDDFWRYDAETLRRSIESERLVLAEAAGRVIGYTLSTRHGPEATIGRLAVVEDRRRCGVGGALLLEGVAHAARNGALGVTLCTQEENDGSRRLYRAAGFREARGRLVSTISPPLAQAGTEAGEPDTDHS